MSADRPVVFPLESHQWLQVHCIYSELENTQNILGAGTEAQYYIDRSCNLLSCDFSTRTTTILKLCAARVWTSAELSSVDDVAENGRWSAGCALNK